MQLETLLMALAAAEMRGPVAVQIDHIAYDSRAVGPDSMFVAIRGTHTDGHRFIDQAITRGAVAIVYDDEQALNSVDAARRSGLAWIKVPNSRAALAPLAAAFYTYPANRLRVVGVTGTKGKTTTATLCAHVLDRGGHRSGMVSTANFKLGSQWSDNTTRQTTPEALEVQQLLQEMVTAGCDHAVVEASSHALSARWNRVGSCAFDVAVFTNVTHEHLDYHGTVEQYRRDKARLFEMLHDELPATQPIVVDKQHKVAVVNLDDPHAGLYLEAAGLSVDHLTYAIEHPGAHVRAIDVDLRSDGVTYTALTPWGEAEIQLRLPGHFNVLNSLAALCVGLAEGIALTECAAALAAVEGVTGRMERVDVGQPFTVIVDYAHNPDSFEQVMAMMRPLTNGKLISVFGSAGERDTEKRALQGAIAGRYCDLVIITDEDPRDEDREAILEAIAVGVRETGKHMGSGYRKIADREQALRAAFEAAAPGDIVLLLGKGHESCIVYEHGRKLPWLERAAAERILHEMGAA
ncbi:MAG: UDP-N-acetylmuramoyl-L-alanyl-D-glutamate--2,6-diaminopimelate ligase [Herpetosiphonaceae bacterium]|nr:UDP-N-acetylmuramoyl-L-alanyl-D-glutamate--2,6-diaminopimelate ligase [Herpetosiphonaceae bacterium]